MRMHVVVCSLAGLCSLAEITSVEAQPGNGKVGKPIAIATGHHGTIYSLVFSPDGKELATSSGRGDPRVHFWDPKTGQRIRSLDAHPSGTWAVAYTPDGTRLVTSAASSKEDVCVWDARKFVKLHSLKGHQHGALVLAISGDGQRLVSVGKYHVPDDVAVWDLTTGERKQTHPKLALSVQTVRFLPDGRTLCVNEYDRIRLWSIGALDGAGVRDLGDFEKVAGANDPDHRRFTMTALSPDGRIVAAGRIGEPTRLLESISGKEIWQTAAGRDGVGIAFSPDGRTIARASVEGIRLFDWPTEQELLTLRGHSQGVYKLAFSPDGTRLASVAAVPEAQTVLLWDLSNVVKRAFPQREVGPKDVDQWSKDLSNPDPRVAYRAVWNLVGVPDRVVPQLKASLGKTQWMTPGDVARCITELSDKRFATRQQASKRLIDAGADVADSLNEALKQSTSLEQTRRLEQFLAAVRAAPMSAEQLLATRALMVLERVNTPEAWRLAEQWAKSTPETRLTTVAREAVERRGRRLALRP